MKLKISEDMKKEYKEMAIYAIALFILLTALGNVMPDVKVSIEQSALASFGFISILFLANKVDKHIRGTKEREPGFIKENTYDIAAILIILAVLIWELIIDPGHLKIPELLLAFSKIGIVAMAIDIALRLVKDEKEEQKCI